MPASENASDQHRDYGAWIALCVMAVCMSLSFVFTKISLEGFTLAQATGGRLVIGAALLLPLAFIVGEGLPLKFWFWKWAVILGLINFVLPFALSTYGQLHLPSNIVGAMFSLIPLLTIALSALILRVTISKRKFLGLVIGLLGLLVISEPAKWVGETGWEHALPMIATLGAIGCFAIAAILMRLMPAVHPLSVTGGSAIVASLFGIYPFVTVFDGSLPPLRPWIGLFGVSVLSTTIAYSIRFYLIRRKGPVFLAPNAYISIILVNVFGVAVLGDAITTPMVIAIPLIIVGLFVALDNSGYMKQV
ncbi:MAG: DMT family transporter [Pseudomonadota bacterium]